jgi:phosphate starvation-inducible protein PhoH
MSYEPDDFFDILEPHQKYAVTKKRAKKEKNKKPVAQTSEPPQKKLTMQPIKPMTDNQALVFDSYYAGRNLFLHGMAGTGKTFVALYLALNDILNRKHGLQ